MTQGSFILRVVFAASAALVTGVTSCTVHHRQERRAPTAGEPTAARPEQPASGNAGHVISEPRRFVPEGAGAPLFNDLGTYSWPIHTSSEMAQRYFDQGLILSYGFNHAEAIRSFREAHRLDPKCAMCFWGEGYALGPNINQAMPHQHVPRAIEVSRRAFDLAATSEERALAAALSERYIAEPVTDRAPLDIAFADAMREAAKQFPENLDIQTLFAESLMTTMPWDYYRDDGSAKPETKEAVTVLESVLESLPNHVGAVHFYIHVVEPSGSPERAEAAADRLRHLVPGAGHLAHMPSHIYLRIGRYHDASLATERAAAADETYIAQCRAQGYYPLIYYPHNVHFLWAAAAFEGRREVSLAAARKLSSLIPREILPQAPVLEEFLPIPLLGLARFGLWDEILREPAPQAQYQYWTGIWRYVRGLARLGRGEIQEARSELDALEQITSLEESQALILASGSSAAALLGIGVDDLAGRLAAAEGDYSTAIGRLRRAIKVQDALPYHEPPPWYFPEREALGNILLQAGQPEEAAEVYRTQLRLTPRNGWSLRGLAESLEAQGRTDDAVEVNRRFRAAWSHADVELAASIF